MEFNISNRGVAALKMNKAASSCGCTLVEIPRESIEPGQATKLRVRVKPRAESGPQNSTVTLASNDPAHPLLVLGLQWYARYPISIAPKSINLGWVDPANSIEREIAVTTTPTVVAADLIVKGVDPCINWTWSETSSHEVDLRQGCTTRRLILSFKPSREVGSRNALVEVQSRDGQFRAVLPLSWRTGPKVSVSPMAVFRSGVPASSSVDVTLIVVGEEASPVDVTGVAIDGVVIPDPIAHTKVAAERAILKFAIMAGDQPGTERHRVTINLGGERPDSIEVPVTLIVR